jgi:hypothetical protein
MHVMRSRRRLQSVARHLNPGAEGLGIAAAGSGQWAPAATVEDYRVAEGFLSWHAQKTVKNGAISPRWLVCGAQGDGTDDVLTYVRAEMADGMQELCIVDVAAEEREAGQGTRVIGVGQLVKMLVAAGAAIEQPAQLKLGPASFKMLGQGTLLLRHDSTAFSVDLDQGVATALSDNDDDVGECEVPSPDGALVLFARDHNLHVRERQGPCSGQPRALTSDGEQHHGYGSPTGATLVTLARKHSDGAQATNTTVARPAAIWSPDSRKVLTSRVDERGTGEYHLIQSAPEDGTARPKLWSYKYSLPGDPIPPAILLVVDVASGTTVQIDTSHVFGDEHDAEGSPVAQDMAWWSDDSLTVRFITGRPVQDLVPSGTTEPRIES